MQGELLERIRFSRPVAIALLTHGCDARQQRDIAYLLQLLEKKEIKPKVLDRMPLSKVARTQEVLEMKQIHGFIVCEPWIKSMQRALVM